MINLSPLKITINAINMTSPGSFVVGREFLNALDSQHDDKNEYLVILPSEYGYENIIPKSNKFVYKFYSRRIFNGFWRVYFHYSLFPRFVRAFKSDVVIVLGSLSPAKLNTPSIVLLHNAFYVDTGEYVFRKLKDQFLRKVETYFFGKTVRHSSRFIVQSTYMKERLSKVWNVPEDRIKIIANSIPRGFEKIQLRDKSLNEKNNGRPAYLNGKFILLYVSMFLPHKNHEFILKLAGELKSRSIQDIVFLITINENSKDASMFLKKVAKQNLSDMIINLGEMPQGQLVQWYQLANILFFPSLMESFGNAFIEAMYFGLPICSIDLPYARAVCGDSAVYFQKDSIKDTIDKLFWLKNNPEKLNQLELKVRNKYQSLMNWNEIAREYLNIAEQLIFNRTHLNVSDI